VGTYDKKIEAFIEQKDELLLPYRDTWFPKCDPKREVNREEVERLVGMLYTSFRRETPVFIWVDSPWQAVTGAILLQFIACGNDGWLKLLADALPDQAWKNSFETVFKQVEPYLEDLSAEAVEKAWFNSTNSRDQKYTEILLECDTEIRAQIGTIAYAQLRSNLYLPTAELPSQSRLENGQVWSYLHTLSTAARMRLRMFRQATRRGGPLPARPARFDGDSLEETLVSVLANDVCETYCRRLEIESEHKDYRRTLVQHVMHSLSSSITGLQWGFPREQWLPLYSFPIDFLSSRFYATPVARFIRSWQRLLSYDIPHLFFNGACFLINQPTAVRKDEAQRLHSETTAAIEYADGFQLFSWHGTTVPPYVVLNPKSITVRSIDDETNAEVRRVMLERFGEERYIEESGARVVNVDSYGVLYRKEFPDDEPLVMVRVENSTPEQDGSFRSYYLRVPPEIQTAHEAVAWTFDLQMVDYHPDKES